MIYGQNFKLLWYNLPSDLFRFLLDGASISSVSSCFRFFFLFTFLFSVKSFSESFCTSFVCLCFFSTFWCCFLLSSFLSLLFSFFKSSVTCDWSSELFSEFSLIAWTDSVDWSFVLLCSVTPFETGVGWNVQTKFQVLGIHFELAVAVVQTRIPRIECVTWQNGCQTRQIRQIYIHH